MSADSQHVELLRRGPRPWNEWRAENPSVLPNLVGIVLSIGDRQMGPINGGPINLTFTRLRHAFLRFATLTRADLEGADLSDTDLRDARLEDANLSGADLSGALLDHADFAGATLTDANLSGASLAGARNLTQQQLHEAEGDEATVLPEHLTRPQAWSASRVVHGSRGRSAPRTEEQPAEPPPSAGERVSWLVGGPRRERGVRTDAPWGPKTA